MDLWLIHILIQLIYHQLWQVIKHIKLRYTVSYSERWKRETDQHWSLNRPEHED